jgi:hypothetical protein
MANAMQVPILNKLAMSLAGFRSLDDTANEYGCVLEEEEAPSAIVVVGMGSVFCGTGFMILCCCKSWWWCCCW